MSSRTLDVVLADHFTTSTHSHATPALDPAKNNHASPLNVCIIGASRGIGAGIAHAYALALASGSTLILAARESSSTELAAVEQRAKELNPQLRILSLYVDITDSKSVESLAQTVKQTTDTKIDILILNSGYSGPVVLKMTEGSPQDFQDVFNVNVQGTYLVAHYFIPLLIASGGAKTFIAVGSFASCITSGHIANTAYCVSKLAQTRLVEYLSEQFGSEDAGGLFSVAVHPGAVNTQMADLTTPDSFRKFLTDDVGLCGAFCLWLTSDRERKIWLNGRLVSATWDVEELESRREEVEGQDLLKFGLRLG